MSTVTISIEEFEDLIESKMKLVEIKKSIGKCNKRVLDINIKLVSAMIAGNTEKLEEIREEGDNVSIDALMEIIKILENKDESRNKR